MLVLSPHLSHVLGVLPPLCPLAAVLIAKPVKRTGGGGDGCTTQGR